MCVCVSTLPFSTAKNHKEGGTLSSPFSPAKGLGGALSSSLIPRQRGPSVPPTPKGPSPPCLVPSPKAPEGTPAASFSQAKGPEGPPPSPQGSGGPSASSPPPRGRAGPHLEGHIAELALPPDLAHHAVAAAGQIAHREMNQVLRVQLRLGHRRRRHRRRLQHLPDRSRRSPPRFASPAPCPRPATVTRPSHTHPTSASLRFRERPEEVGAMATAYTTPAGRRGFSSPGPG